MSNPIRDAKAYPTDRRGVTGKTDSDVVPRKWPVITMGIYKDIHAKGIASGASQELISLCRARNSLGQLLLAMDKAMHEQKEINKEVWYKLQSIDNKLQTAYMDFPLTIENRVKPPTPVNKFVANAVPLRNSKAL